MDREKIIQLIIKDKMDEAIEMIINSISQPRKIKIIRLIKARLLSLEEENMSGVLNSEDYAIGKNKIRKDLMSVIDLDPSSSFSIENLIDTLKDEKLSFSLNEIAFEERKKYKKFCARLTRRYNWTATFDVNISNKDVSVAYNKMAKEILVRFSYLKLSPLFKIKDQKSATIAAGTKLWNEKVSKDGIFWQDINEETKAKVNEKFLSDRSFAQQIESVAREKIYERLSELIDEDDLGDSRLVIKFQKIESYNGESIALN